METSSLPIPMPDPVILVPFCSTTGIGVMSDWLSDPESGGKMSPLRERERERERER